MEEALVWDAHEMGSIESWRRGIAEVEAHSVATSVDGEFITPEATRQKKERIKERRREERASGWVGEERSTKTKRVGSVAGDSVTNEHIIKKKDVAPSESGRSERSSASKGKGKEMVVKEKEKKSKKSSAIGILFKKSKEKAKEKEKKGSSVSKTHRPKMIETS